jgi:nicotinic acid mononucleotide adenylyltransferase
MYVTSYDRYRSARIQIMDTTEKARSVYWGEVASYDAYERSPGADLTLRLTNLEGENNLRTNGEFEPSPRKASVRERETIAKIISSAGRELDGIEQATGKKETATLLSSKILSNLARIRSRIFAGDFHLPGIPEANLQSAPQRMVVLAMPGMYDPPHFNHADLLLEAFATASRTRREQPTTYAGFFVPLVNGAPGPDGSSLWKEGALPAEARYNLCNAMTMIFNPLMDTSIHSKQNSNEYGVQTCIRTFEEYREKSALPVDCYIVAGADTFCRWHANFDQYLSVQRKLHPDVETGVITFDSQTWPVASIMEQKRYENVTIIGNHFNLEIHSQQFRTGEDLSLLTSGVREQYLTLRGTK